MAARRTSACDAAAALRKSKIDAKRNAKRCVGLLPGSKTEAPRPPPPSQPPAPISKPHTDVVGPAMTLLTTSSTPDEALAALYKLKTLSNDDAVVGDMVAHPAAIPLLTASLLKSLPVSFEAGMVTSQALDCLCNLSLHSDGCLKIVAVPGFMDAVVRLHLMSPSPSVADSALAVIANLAADSAALRASIVAMPHLPDALQHVAVSIASQACPQERYVDTFVWCLTNLLQNDTGPFNADVWRRRFDLAMAPLTYLLARVPWRAMDPDIAAMMLDVVHKLLEPLDYRQEAMLKAVGCSDAVGALLQYWESHTALYTDTRLFRTALYRLLQCCKLLAAGPETAAANMAAATWPVVRAMALSPPPTRAYLRELAVATLRGCSFHATFARKISADDELLGKLTQGLGSGETKPEVRADIAHMFHLLIWRLRYAGTSGALHAGTTSDVPPPNHPSKSLLDTLVALQLPAALVRNLRLHIDAELTSSVLACVDILLDMRRATMLEVFEELRLPAAVDALMEDEAVKAAPAVYTRLAELAERYFDDDGGGPDDDLEDLSTDANPFAHFV